LKEARNNMMEEVRTRWTKLISDFGIKFNSQKEHASRNDNPETVKAIELPVEELFTKLIGNSTGSAEFNTFYMWAVECKMLRADMTAIGKYFRISESSANKIGMLLLDAFIDVFYETVWKQRNDHMIKWEKDHNILNNQKRNKQKNRFHSDFARIFLPIKDL
jgi:hypothetical protein